jgi:hypothetical protein
LTPRLPSSLPWSRCRRHRDEGGPYVQFVALPIRWKTLADRRQQATDFGE